MKTLTKILSTFVSLMFVGVVSAQTVVTSKSYKTDFEDLREYKEWRLNTGRRGPSCFNKWYFGIAGANTGNAGLFVSGDEGATNAYVGKPTSVVAYRPIVLDEGYYEFSFDWQAGGVQNVDGLYVCWVPESEVDTSLLASIDKSPFLQTDFVNEKYGLFFGSDSLGLGQRTWNSLSDTIYSDGTRYNLVFVWRNGVVGLVPPAVAIDNIMITEVGLCNKPTNLSVAQKGDDVILQWKGDADSYDIRYTLGPDGEPHYIDSVTTKYYEVKDLFAGIATFYVRSRCGNERSAWTSLEKFVYSTGGTCLNYLNLDGRCFTGKTTGLSMQPGMVDFGYLAMESRHTIHWKQDEYDARTLTGGVALKTVPPGEIASVRLGNWGVQYETESIEYDYIVDSTKSAILLLNYAVILQDPQHEAKDQPKFTLEILKNKNEPLDEYGCGEAFFTAGENTSGEGWYAAGGGSGEPVVWWKDWTTIAINLREYHGQSLKIRLQTFDCNQGAHFGYAYFTLGCSDGKIRGLSCAGDERNKFEGPEGFLYRWYLPSDPDNTLWEGRVLDVDPNDTLTYYLDVIQPTNKQCYYTLSASAVARYPVADADYKIDVGNCQNVVRFTNKSSILRVNQVSGETTLTDEPCESFTWIFEKDDLSFRDSVEAEHPTYSFPEEGGIYNVTLKAYIAGKKCYADTTFAISLPTIGAVRDTTFATVCFGEPYMLNGRPIFVSGTYSDTLLNEYGCEVISSLTLDVLPKPEDVLLYDTICSDVEYYFNDKLITETGIYRDTVKTLLGCDSITTLDILVNEALHVEFDSMIVACADDEEIVVPYNVTSGNLLAYNAKIDLGGGLFDEQADLVPEEDVLTIPMPDSIVPGNYSIGLTFSQKSCAPGEIILPVKVYYSKTVLAQRWNDVLAVKNEDYNGGYEFIAFQWYKNGQIIEGATSSILYQPEGLDLNAEYAVLLTRLSDNVTTMTCVAELKDLSGATDSRVLVFTADNALEVETAQVSKMKIWTPTGILLKEIDLTEGSNIISTSGMSGMHILDFLFKDEHREIKQVVFE